MKNEKDNNALVAQEASAGALSVDLQLNNYQVMKDVSMDFAKSGIFGEITQSQGFVSLCAMRDEGLSVSGFRRKYQWVGNEMSTRPNWMLGEFKRRGGKVHIIQCDAEACEIEFTHWDGELLRMRITMEQMKKTDVPFSGKGELKKNWKNFADDMLFARVCGKALRRLAPEVFAGVYTDGEAQDFDIPKQAARKTVKISAEAVKSRLATMSGKLDDEPEPTNEEMEQRAKEQDASAAEIVEAEVVVPEVVASEPSKTDVAISETDGSKIADEIAKMTVPIKGDHFGRTFGDLAENDPDLVMMLLKCNRVKHPELTDEHVAALEKIASIINEG